MNNADDRRDGPGYDAFISYARDERDAVVRPLYEHLTDMGLRIWFDEFEVKVGDSIQNSINRGMRDSSYGIVVLSEAYLERQFPVWELEGFLRRRLRNAERRKVLLPLYYGVDEDYVGEYSHSLAGLHAMTITGDNIEEVAGKLYEVINEEEPQGDGPIRPEDRGWSDDVRTDEGIEDQDEPAQGTDVEGDSPVEIRRGADPPVGPSVEDGTDSPVERHAGGEVEAVTGPPDEARTGDDDEPFASVDAETDTGRSVESLDGTGGDTHAEPLVDDRSERISVFGRVRSRAWSLGRAFLLFPVWLVLRPWSLLKTSVASVGRGRSGTRALTKVSVPSIRMGRPHLPSLPRVSAPSFGTGRPRIRSILWLFVRLLLLFALVLSILLILVSL